MTVFDKCKRRLYAKSMYPAQRAFTLVELLIVISIISVLSVIGIVSYTGILKNSRDSKRLSDLKIIQSALQEYHSDQIYYPVVGAGNCPGTGDGKLRLGCSFTNPTGAKTYLTKVPNDPITTQNYSYVPTPIGCDNATTMCTNYCLYTSLEGANIPQSDPGCSPSSPLNYGLTRP